MRCGIVGGLAIIAAAVAATGQVQAAIVTGDLGLASPTTTITFDELGNLQGEVITNQFQPYGATFSNFGWDDATRGQRNARGFFGGDLVNGVSGFPSGTMMISFNCAVYEAAFAALDKGMQFTISSYQGSNLVETFSLSIDWNPGIGFIGFENSLFDRIEIAPSPESAISIDTLQFSTAVPEPTGLAIWGSLGALGLIAVRRRKRVA